jgi:hypothetical protein
MHMVSDVLSTMVGAAVFPGKATVITSRSANAHSEAERQLGGVNLTYCSIHEDNKNIAGNLMTSVMEAAENKRNIILFLILLLTLRSLPARTKPRNCTVSYSVVRPICTAALSAWPE